MTEENKQEGHVEVPVVETEARTQGWVPKTEFRGKEEDWIDAETFVKRGREINPILKQNNDRLRRELDLQKKETESLRAGVEEFKKFQKEQTELRVKKYEEEIKSLREEKKQAISSGDGERAVQIDDQIDALKEEKASVKQEAKETPPAKADEPLAPEVVEWIDKNGWYKRDVHMMAITNEEAEKIKMYHPHLTGKEFFDKLDEALEKKFSLETLGREKKSKPRNPVEGATGSGSVSGSKGKETYENLPAEARTACDRFVKQKLLTKEQFVVDYYAQF